jgi:hypothetical protein
MALRIRSQNKTTYPKENTVAAIKILSIQKRTNPFPRGLVDQKKMIIMTARKIA